MTIVNSYDFHIYQGETWGATLNLKDSTGVAKDLTGYSAKMQIREKPGDTVLDELATTPGTGISISGVLGIIDLSRAASITAEYTFIQAEYDLFLKSGTGTEYPLLRGNIIVGRRITKV